MGKNRYASLKTDEERKKYIRELLTSYKESIVKTQTLIVEWQSKLNTILEKEERLSKTTIRRSRSFSNIVFNTRRTRKDFSLKRCI